MRQCLIRSGATVSLGAVLISAVGFARPAMAATWYFDGDAATTANTGASAASNAWNLATSNWRVGSDTGALNKWSSNLPSSSAEAVFGGTAGTVGLGSSVTLPVNKITFTTDGYLINPNGGSFVNFDGSATTATIDAGPGISATFKTAFQGSFTKTGAGTVSLGYFAGTFNAAMSPTSVTVAAGTLKTGSQNTFGSLAAPGSVIVNGGALDLNGFTSAINATNEVTQVGSLSGSGGVITNNGSVNATIKVGVGNSAATSFGGVIQNGAFSSALQVGDGTSTPSLTLTAHNTFTGVSTVRSGTLLLDNGGFIGGNIAITGGVLSAGTGGTGGTIDFHLTNDSADLIAISAGTLNLTNLRLNVLQSGTQNLGEYVLADKTVGSSFVTGSQFLSTSLPSGWSVDYDGTTANPNAIVLIVGTPEPAGILVAAAAFGGVLVRRRSQRVA